jgi:hypothetical protein
LKLNEPEEIPARFHHRQQHQPTLILNTSPHSNRRFLYSNLDAPIFLFAARFLMVPAQQPKVAVQHPFRG